MRYNFEKNMPLYAHNQSKEVIFSAHAQKTQPYTCIECGEELRMRSSIRIRPHFYHVKPRLRCLFATKSLQHLQTQWHLAERIPSLKLEQRFSSIQRIADCVWEEEKVIFEIQCSPIQTSEILGRNKDYASLGYQVIWIFHDKQYNRWRISPAEELLSAEPHYYTNIDKEGRGYFYSKASGKKEKLSLSIFQRDASNLLFFGSPIQRNQTKRLSRVGSFFGKVRDGMQALFLFILEDSCK